MSRPIPVISPPGPGDRMTARVFLFGDEPLADTVDALSRELERHGAAWSALHGVRRLSAGLTGAVDREVAVVADGLLDLDLGDALIGGWRRYAALTDAARRTAAAPGSHEVVRLATHRVASTYRPRVDLLVDGVTVHDFVFELSVVFDVTGLAAVVRDGQLCTLLGGECLVSATLELQGARLAERQQRIEPSVLVRLDPPRSLLAAEGPGLAGGAHRPLDAGRASSRGGSG